MDQHDYSENSSGPERHVHGRLVFIRTFGCQMNVHDSLRMQESLVPIGFRPTDEPAQADLIIVNTCTVREKSRGKVLSALGRYARHKQDKPGLLLAVAGCVAQQEGEALLKEIPELDLVVGPDQIGRLPELVATAARARTVETAFEEVSAYRFLRPVLSGPGSPTALVTIQKGCDNRCAYCVVPLVRGPEASRPASEILAEVRILVEAGTREVTLIGQNVNAYRGGLGQTSDFIRLLEAVAAIPGLLRLRFTTSHPKDLSPELARAFATPGVLCPWLHLPLQSGSSRVLQAMNRGYDRGHYLDQVRAVRAQRPDISLGTDLIVGFPGESDADFEETLSIVEEIQYDYAYSFKYSVRHGTAAASLPDSVPEAEKDRRLQVLQQRLGIMTEARLARFEGQVVKVLVEGPSRKGLSQVSGRTPGNHVVNIDDPDGATRPGTEVEVRVERALRHSLRGRLVRPD